MLGRMRQPASIEWYPWSWRVTFPWIRQCRVEAVEVCARRFFYQPLCFRRRGVVHRVYRIERVWERTARPHQSARRYFTVCCEDGQRYTLFHDLEINTWYIVCPGG